MAAGPDHLSLRSFSVAKEQDHVIVRTAVDIEPREAMRHLLRDGAQMLLTCTTYLERQRSLLPRSTMATNTAAMVLSYDPLSRQYLLSMALPEDMETYEDLEVSATSKNASEVHNADQASPSNQDGQHIQQAPKVPATGQAYGHRDFNSLMDNTLGRLRMPLCSSDMLEADEEYFATIRVELRHTKVPPWLSQALFFWSWDVVPSIEFTQVIQGN